MNRAHPRRRRRARTAWPHLLLTLPSALALAASPVSAAMPGVAWIEICSGSLTHWIAVRTRSDGPAGQDRDHALCAHATCPRETRVDRKPRLPAP